MRCGCLYCPVLALATCPCVITPTCLSSLTLFNTRKSHHFHYLGFIPSTFTNQRTKLRNKEIKDDVYRLSTDMHNLKALRSWKAHGIDSLPTVHLPYHCHTVRHLVAVFPSGKPISADDFVDLLLDPQLDGIRVLHAVKQVPLKACHNGVGPSR